MLGGLYMPLEPSGARRGGHRQRAARDEADREAAANARISRLAGRHLLRWADGEESAAQVVQSMQDEVADQLDLRQQPHPMVKRLSEVGDGQHAHAGLRALLERNGLLALQSPVPDAALAREILLPSTLVRLLFNQYRWHFRTALGADTVKLRAFWTEFLARPRSRAWAQRHFALRDKSPGDLVCMLPVVVHTDAGPCTKRKSAHCVSWSGLLGTGSEKVTKFFAFTYLKATSDGDAPAWQALVRDFRTLATDGVASEGRRRWKMVLLACKSDEEARANEMGLVHWGGPEPCSDCLCDRSAGEVAAVRPFTDLSRGAAWVPTQELTFE